LLRLTKTESGHVLEKKVDAKFSVVRLKGQLLGLVGAVRGGSFWRVTLLLLLLATVQSCKPSKPQTDMDMVGTYALTANTPLSMSDGEFDYVKGTRNPLSPSSTIVLRPDHTFAVTNFPALLPGAQRPFYRWNSGELVSTNGRWAISAQTQKTELGMSDYIVHKLVLQIPGRDSIAGHISRWPVDVQFDLEITSNQHRPLFYKRVN
jgi:hypothetical protein